MNVCQPLVCCSSSPGKHQNVEMGVTEGACGPVVIHSDSAQAEEKKRAERKRQRSGETPEDASVKSRFVRGADSPGASAQTSKRGSMTQEIFCDICKRFVRLPPEERDLDGRASRRSAQVLKHLDNHGVFALFFASHASVWAQPSDCGSNKRVHWAIEDSNKERRCTGAPTTCERHNRIFQTDGATFSMPKPTTCWKRFQTVRHECAGRRERAH